MKNLGKVTFLLLVGMGARVALAESRVCEQDADITVADGFSGEIFVSNATVKATFEGSASVVLKTAGKAQFVKLGSGTPAIRAFRGANAGTVEVGEGSVRWIGPSGVEAPGAFDVVKVRAGASLLVDASPADLRHAYVFRGGVREDDVNVPQEEKDNYETWTGKLPSNLYRAAYGCSYTAFDLGLWDGFFQKEDWPGEAGVREGVLAVSDGEAMFNGRDEAYPAAYFSSSDKLWLHYRAMFVVAREGQKTVVINQNTSAGKVFVDGKGSDGWDGAHVMTNGDWNLSAGFHEIAASSYFNGSSAGSKRSFFLNRPLEFGGDDGRWESGLLWHGACCNALVVEKDGNVEIAGGQALGVAQTDGCDLQGEVTGGADSVLALLSTSRTVASPEDWFSLGSLGGFAGTVELGKSVRAYVPAGAAFAGMVDGGEATVAFGAASAVAQVASFDGTAVVPKDVTIPAGTFAESVRVLGAGTLTVSDPADAPATFCGTLACENGDVRLGRPLNAAADVALGGTGTLTVDAQGRYEASQMMTDGFAGADWLLCGQTGVKTGTLPDNTTVTFAQGTKPTLNADGSLTLTDFPGRQAHGAFLSGMDLTADSCVELAFDMTVGLAETIPAEFADHGVTKQEKSGAFMILVARSEPGAFFGKELYGEGSYGFRASVYGNGNIAGIYNGFIDDKMDGFPTDGPVHVDVRLVRGVLNVRFSDAGGTRAYQADVSDAFAGGQVAHLALLGSTDWWDKSDTLVYNRTTLSNMRISQTRTDDPPYVRDTAVDASKESWTAYKPGEWTTIDGSNAIPVIPSTQSGGRYAICNQPVALDRPWVYSWKAQHSKEVGKGTYTYQSFYLQGEGPAGTIVAGGTNPARPMENSACYGFALDTGHADSSSKNTFLWLNGKMATKPSGEDWIKGTWTRPAAGSTVTNVVEYDGHGTLTVRIVSMGETFTTNMTMTGLADLAESGAKWYLTHVGYNNSGSGGGTVLVYDTDLEQVDFSVPSPAVVRPAITVAAGADQTIALGDFGATDDDPSVAFPSVVLGEGARVTVSSSVANGGALLSALEVSGTATFAAGANVRLSLGTVVARSVGSRLALDGSFAVPRPIRIVVPRGKAAEETRLVVDFSKATFAGGAPSRESFVVVYADGTAVPEGCVALSGKGLTVWSKRIGTVIILQ